MGESLSIAVLAASPVKTNGWGRYARDLITALHGAGHTISLITSRDAAETPDLPVAAYHRILPGLAPAPRLSSLRILATAPRIRQIVANADVVHITAEPYALATLGVSRPLVVTAHGTYIPQTARRTGTGWLYRAAYRRACILCVSHYTERQVQQVLPGATTELITNGVTIGRFRDAEQDTANSVDKRGSAILVVGQLKARKGFHIVAQAMREIRRTVPYAEAIFIGDMSDTAYCQMIKAQLEADGIPDAVRWLGRVPDDTLIGWYHAADLFALPALNVDGKFEGFGLVYLEAGAAGLPVIGTLDCGAEDVIRDGEIGYLIPQNDPAALARRVIDLLQSPDLRRRLGEAGRQEAARHTWDQVARQVTELYCRVRQ